MGLMDWTGRSHREREDSLHSMIQQEIALANDPANASHPEDRARHLANAEMAAAQIFPNAWKQGGLPTQPPKHRGGLIGHIQNLLMGPPQQGAGLAQGINGAPAEGLGGAASPGTPPSTGQQAGSPEPAPNVNQTPNLAASMDDPNENGYMASMGTIAPPPPQGSFSPLDQTPPAPTLPQGTPPPQTGTPARAGGGIPMNAAARSLPTPSPLQQQQPALQPPNEEGVYSAMGPMGMIRTLSPARVADMEAQAKNASLNTAMTGSLQRMNRLNEDPLAQKLQAGQLAQMATGGKISPGQKLAPSTDRPQSGAVLREHFPVDMQGTPTDPNQQYIIHRDPLTGNSIGIEQTATRGMMGPLQSQGGGQFSKPILDPATGNVRSQVATIPPPAYATRTTKTSGSHETAVRQPDGSIRVVPMGRGSTTTRSVQVPPTPGSTPMSGGAAGVTTTTPPATAASSPRSSRPARGGMAANGMATTGGQGRVIGGTAPTDREKTNYTMAQESLRLGDEIEKMVESMPPEDRKGGAFNMVMQSAKMRAGNKAYAMGFNPDKFQRQLFAKIDLLKQQAGQGMQQGNNKGYAMAQLINKHLPDGSVDAPDQIIDKIETMGHAMAHYHRDMRSLSPQLENLMPPIHNRFTKETDDSGGLERPAPVNSGKGSFSGVPTSELFKRLAASGGK